MFSIEYKANGFKTEAYLRKLQRKNFVALLHECGKKGVEALTKATPRDTGLTADSWRYEIVSDKRNGRYSINWINDNTVNEWYNVAIMIQYGHGTRSGAWVEGIDYINPAMKPIFDEFSEKIRKEVEK